MTTRRLLGGFGLLLAVIFLLAVNLLSDVALRGVKADLTEAKLYTLTPGTRNILGGLDDPITLKYYFSEKLALQQPGLVDYGRRVEEMLQQYAEISGGKIRLEVVDPEPFSEQEEAAVAAGIQGIPISQEERIYFGLQGVNSIDGKNTIPFFDPNREQFLEYDVSKLISDLSNPEPRKLTILTDLPLDGGYDPMRAMSGQEMPEPWVIYSELKELYETSVIDSTATELPATDVLLIIHPKNLKDQLLYEIDQYVLKGGKAVVFVDPLADAEEVPQDPRNPLQSMQAPRNSEMPKLFDAWGLKLVPGMLAGDKLRAQQAVVGSQNKPEVVNYILWLGLRPEEMNKEETILGSLNTMNMATVGILEKAEGGTTSLTPLLQTSKESMRVEVSKAQMFPDPKALAREFVSQDKQEILAARVTGKASTAFPEGVAKEQTEADKEEGKTPTPEKKADHVDSSDSINVIVFADVDLLSDAMWIRIQRFFNMKIPQVLADNGYLAMNMVDQMSGSEDLIGIRGRGKSQRPFTLIEEMQRQAQSLSDEKIKELEKKLEETRTKLRELQQEAPDGSGMRIATSDLKTEIEKFEKEERQTAIELRRVELAKRRDIEKLETKLKVVNIGLIPLVVGVFAVGMGIVRTSRRRRR